MEVPTWNTALLVCYVVFKIHDTLLNFCKGDTIVQLGSCQLLTVEGWVSPRAAHVVNRVVLGQVFLNSAVFSASVYQFINTRTCKIGTFVAIVSRNLVSLHPDNKTEACASPFIVIVTNIQQKSPLATFSLYLSQVFLAFL